MKYGKNRSSNSFGNGFYMCLTSMLLGINLIKAQTQAPDLQPTLAKVDIPSPSAYAITKFGNVPVSPATGIPNITVPLYTFSNATGLSLDVSLDYHAGGVRVDEISSVAGIGWALKTGGVITRNLRGIFDEYPSFGFFDNVIPPTTAAGNDGESPYDRSFNKMANNTIDSQNDIFTYNFGGYSGKFHYGKGEALLIGNLDKLVIEKIESSIPNVTFPTRITGFIITDPKGFKYHFEAYEVTNDQSNSISNYYTSAWYLTKILPPSGIGPILLEYEGTSASYTTGRSFSEAIKIPNALIPHYPENPHPGAILGNSIQGKRIRYIHLPDGVKLTFDYSATEKNAPQGEFLLKKISISNATGVRGFKLTHDNSLNRPTLKSVIPFTGPAETPDLGYAFEYDIPLPDRLSTHQDHWGFYNTNNHGGLAPTEILPVPNGQYGGYEVYNGGDRSTDPIRCKAGSLKRVRYPTGGYTDYEFEVNRAVDPRLDTRTTRVKEIYSREDVVTAYTSSSSTNTTTFNYQGDLNATTQFSVQVPSSSFSCSGSCKVVIEIRNPSGLLLDIRYIDPPSSSSPPAHTFSLSNLAHGNHTLTTYTQGITSNYFAYVNFRWTESRNQNPITETVNLGKLELYVGGLRAKKISDYDGISATPVNVREFEYLMEDGVTSSGTLGFYPVYTVSLYYDYRELPVEQIAPETYEGQNGMKNYFLRSGSTIWPLAYSQGAPAAYKRVVEKFTASGSGNGRKESYFSSFETSPVIIHTAFPFTPPGYTEWTNGKVQEVRYYNQSNQIVKKELYNYQNLQYAWPSNEIMEKFRSVTIAPVSYVDDMVGSELQYWTVPCYYLSNNFYPQAGRMEMTGMTEITYDPLGNSISNEKTFSYDPGLIYLKSSSTTDSKGIPQVIEFKYPPDMVASGQDPTGIYQQMVQKNMLLVPIEQLRKQNTTQLELVRYNYSQPHTNVIVPQSIESKHGTRPIETRVQFSAYSTGGNLLEQRKRQGENQVYLWGYNQQHPVAVLTGSSYAEAIALVNQGILNAPPDDPTLRSALSVLRNIPNSLVKTYTYNPLYGITSETDEKGRIAFYEYDGFGRLKLKRDQEQKILQMMDYKYQSNP